MVIAGDMTFRFVANPLRQVCTEIPIYGNMMKEDGKFENGSWRSYKKQEIKVEDVKGGKKP
jgi:hypothetical protein